jgi:hypothetical protein
MTGAEIIAYLNSGQYISSNTRKQLEEKLNTERKTNRFSPMKEFFALINPNSVNNNTKPKNNKKIKIENTEEAFPSLQQSIPANIPQPTINFANIINPTNPINTQSSENIPLFVDDNLVLRYDDLQKIYDDCALYRIRLDFLSLNRKIRCLDILEISNKTKAKFFKETFDYKNMVEQEKKMRKCIDICIGLEFLKTQFKNCGLGAIVELCNNTVSGKENFKQQNIIKSCCETKNIFVKEMTLVNKFNDEYGKYSDEIKEIFQYANNIVDKIANSNSEDISTITKKISLIYCRLDDILTNIIKDNDPHIDCDYHITLKSSPTNPTELARRGPIILEGLSTWTYVSCNEPVDLSLNDKLLDIDLDKDCLNYISEDELDNFFNERIKHDTNFIYLYPKDHIQYCICIYYNTEKIPKAKVTVKITDLPNGSSTFTSILRNYSLDDTTDGTI